MKQRVRHKTVKEFVGITPQKLRTVLKNSEFGRYLGRSTSSSRVKGWGHFYGQIEVKAKWVKLLSHRSVKYGESLRVDTDTELVKTVVEIWNNEREELNVDALRKFLESYNVEVEN